MMRILLTFLLFMAMLPVLLGQTAGEGIYSFMQLTNSAKTAALGGVQIALPDPDPELLLQNPALLSPEMNNTLSVNYAKYLAGIGFGYGAYARDLGKFGMAAIGIQFVDYGQFVAADETGVITGSFSASDYALSLTWATTFANNFTVGASIKPIYSHLESYRSFGLAADIGIVRHSTNHQTTIALCYKQLGRQLTTYYEGASHEKLAGSLQFGYTHQLLYAPLRISLTAYDLTKWSPSVTATDPNGIDLTAGNKSLIPMLMRHLSMGAELFPENKVTLRIGYNYRRHSDLTTTDQTGLAGFTTGLGINLPALRFNYALSGYSLGSMVHNLSLTANLSRIL
ncbi:MAG: type IX secretion system protein PorQ [Prolixibacteraceae bacterium]|nr:type IX secretion system protein PorQ [Prolixibacteraceae bacterium]